jgi:regulatory protein
VNDEQFTHLLQLAYKFLSFRSRSRLEMVDYLRSKTDTEDLVNRVVAQLEQAKLIDDLAFASWVVESRSRSHPHGIRSLQQELYEKGISKEIIAQVVEQIDEVSLAQTALASKMSVFSRLSSRDFRIKAGRFLASRGFSWGAIEEALKKAYNHKDVS